MKRIGLAGVVLMITGCAEPRSSRGGGGIGARETAAIELGVVTGAIYTETADWFGVPQSFASHGEAIACDLSESLGARWIRIEADWANTGATDYQHLVAAAHAAGLQVLVVVNATNCGGAADFVETYHDRIVDLADDVFTGPARADAYELLNEPNTQCDDNAFLVDPVTFAELVNVVGRTFADRPERIVAGAPLNTSVQEADGTGGEPFWIAYLDALQAEAEASDGSAPFDYFGVHPYNPYDLYAGPATPQAPDFDTWRAATRRKLDNLVTRLRAIYPDLPARPLFVTEFGFDADGDGGIAVANAEQARTGFETAVQLFDDVGTVAAAFWYSYRDYPELGGATSSMGLRLQYDGTGHPAREVLWDAFAAKAGGSAVPRDACFHRGAILHFAGHNDRDNLDWDDWRPGSYKAECPRGQAIKGLSVGTTDTAAHAALCTTTRDAFDGPHDAGTCYVRSMAGSDDPNPIVTDWDFGYYKAHCDAGDAVVGISQSSDLKVDGILCCPADVTGSNCSTLVYDGANNRQSTASGDWDDGYVKNECAGEDGVTIRGVSRDVPTGRPHAIWCCR